MTWEKVTEWLSQFFDKDVVIVIVGITYALVVGLILFSKTSLGKKAIAKLTDLFKKGVEIANDTNKKVEEVEKLANEKINHLESEYEKKTTALVSIVDFYEESLFGIIEKIPNAKVQKELLVLKDSYLEKKKEINKWVTLTYQDQQEEVKELVAEIQEEKDLEIARLTSEINELKDLIKPLLKETEAVENGEETQESENTETTQANL